MSVTISGTTIKMTRGDTVWATSLPTYRDGTPYEKQTGDVVRFALKNAQLKQDGSDFVDEEPLVDKELDYDSTHEYWVLHLIPSDTEDLPFGNYKYDIELTQTGGDVYTYIANAKLKLTPEVE